MANDNYKKTEIFDYTMTKELFEGIKKLSKQNNQNKLTSYSFKALIKGSNSFRKLSDLLIDEEYIFCLTW